MYNWLIGLPGLAGASQALLWEQYMKLVFKKRLVIGDQSLVFYYLISLTRKITNP
jgi:hypothetical protein